MVRTFHRLAGIAIAIPLALTALSGALLLLRDPFYRSRFPVVATPVTATSADARGAVLDRIDTMFAPARPRVVKFPREGFNAYHVFLTDGSEALVDPRGGDRLDRWRWNERLMPFLFELHAHLLGGDTGKILNGVAAVGAVLLAATGTIVWWPRRRTLSPAGIVPASITPAALLRSHAGTGVLVALPLMLFTGTGAGIVFYEPVSRLVSRAFDRRAPIEPAAVVTPADAPVRPWRELVAVADATFGGTRPAMVYRGTPANAVVTFRTRLEGEWHPNGRSYVLVNPYDASVVQSIDARAQGAGTRAMHALYPIHSARTGGAPMVALAAASGVALGWLGIGGAWLYAGRAVRVRWRCVCARYRATASSRVGNRTARSDPRAL